MVRGTTPSPDPTTSGTTIVGSAATPNPLPPVPWRRPRPEPSRVAALKRLLRKSGFSRGAALEMSSCVRESTARSYQSQWLFLWLVSWKGIAPIDATIPLIVDFLIHLRRDKGFSLSALKGYRSATNSVLALKGTDIAESRELTMFFRSFAKSCPTADLCPPAWDVALVLNSLTAAPYEPLKDAEERLLAHKMLFLLVLVSAKRVGELHALSHRVSHSVGWKEVSFSFVPGFVAKPRTSPPSTLGSRASRFQPYQNRGTLPMGDFCARYVQSSTTWPAPLNIARSASDCSSAPGAPRRRSLKNTVSFWLRRVISLAYQLSGKPLPTPSSLAQETLGIAPSLLFKKNYAVSQVLKAGTWRCHTTFTCHYLRDLSHKSLDTFHLGPVVAAQAMV